MFDAPKLEEVLYAQIRSTCGVLSDSILRNGDDRVRGPGRFSGFACKRRENGKRPLHLHQWRVGVPELRAPALALIRFQSLASRRVIDVVLPVNFPV